MDALIEVFGSGKDLDAPGRVCWQPLRHSASGGLEGKISACLLTFQTLQRLGASYGWALLIDPRT